MTPLDGGGEQGAAWALSLLASIESELRDRSGATPFLTVVCDLARSCTPGAEWASITRHDRAGTLISVAHTDERAWATDRLRSASHADDPSGATVKRQSDAGVDIMTSHIDHDGAPTDHSARMFAAYGVRGSLSHAVGPDAHGRVITLTVYSRVSHAFDGNSVMVGRVLALILAARVADESATTELDQVRGSVSTNREVGVAMGILMARHLLDREGAFALLRKASQNSNRKLRDLAVEVADTGELPAPAPCRSRTP